MSVLLTPEELALFVNAPEDDLVDLAVDLDVLVPDEIVRAQLLSACIQSLAALAQREGLPLSPYDYEDQADLAASERNALARLCGLEPGEKEETIDRMLKAGKRVYKIYKKHRKRSQIPLYLPMLLAPLARLLAALGGRCTACCGVARRTAKVPCWGRVRRASCLVAAL